MQTTNDTSSSPQSLTVRQFVYAWLFDPHNPNNFQKKFDHYIFVLIVLNALSLLAEQIPVVHDPYAWLFTAFEQFSLAAFTIEYVLRFYVAPEDPDFAKSRSARFAFVRSPYALIDLAAILPFYLSMFSLIAIDLRMLRALRLLRLAKLFRMVIPAMKEFREMNQGRTFRQQVYALLHPTETSGRMQEMLDSFVVWWVFISVCAVVLESVESIHYVLNVHFIVLDAVAVFIFSMEYIFRLYSCVEDPQFAKGLGRYRYAKTPIVMIDFLAIVPFFLESMLHQLFDLRFLRIFRLMRLLKLTRYTTSTGTLLKALKREWPVIAASTFIMLLLVVLTASLGYLFEHDAQPDKFENIPQSIYWAVVTLASVGYGDISPVTPVGRLMTIIMALVGIGIFAVPAAVLSTAFNDQLHKDREVMHNELMHHLKDGELSEEEHQQILKAAAELHISAEEVEILIERAKLESEQATKGQLPMAAIAERPEVAFEQFRTMVGNMRQIMSAGDTASMHQLFETPGRATDDEKAVWRQLYRS